MAALVHRIKDKVRSRSSSRSSTTSPITSRTSTDVPRVPDRHATTHAPSSSSPLTPSDGFARTSLENSAFHVTRGGGARPSVDSTIARKPLPSTTSQHHSNYSIVGEQSAVEDLIPARGSSRHGLEEEQIRPHTRGQAAEEQSFPGEENIPERASSKQAPTTPSRTARPVSNSYDPGSPSRGHTRRVSIPDRLASRQPADPELSKPLPEIPIAHKSNMAPLREAGHSSTPLNEPVSSSAWMSPIISTGQPQQQKTPLSRSQNDDAAKYEALARGHLTLPDGFNMQNTEETHVYETQRPAVTHETIIKERTEIIHEEITRDIHIHHYYTYQQPIKIVEILPPKHYFLDLETGLRTEIDPPFGWTMPASMFPISPDTSQVAAWTRHYLVNDENPYGIPEEAPVTPHGPASSALQAELAPQHRA